MILDSDGLPALHTAANKASLVGQRRYLRVLKSDLIVVSLGAMVGAFHSCPDYARALNGISAVLFVAGFFLTLLLITKNYERIWYGGRAAAESVKTLAWRYATDSEPFRGVTAREADAKFVEALREVMLQRTSLNIVVEDVPIEGRQITDGMRHLREKGFRERLDIYLSERVEEQRRWYASKSTFNAKRENLFFVLVLVAQGFAALYAIFLVALPDFGVSLTGLFTTCATGLLVWMQAKQYQELAQSYAVASHELSLAAEQAKHVDSDDSLSEFVSDTESAISREHTLWAARRDRLPRMNRI